MFDLFIEGGIEFMALLTILAIAMLYFAVKVAMTVYGSATYYSPKRLYYVRFFGMLALVFGILGQLIGLYEAMKQISLTGGISQQILAGGIKVSTITTLYGFFIFVIAHLIWFVLDLKVKHKEEIAHR